MGVPRRLAGARAPAEDGTLAELLRQPGERTFRDVLLLLLTFTAGWTDAVAYAELGHVFASFMSGNFLFFGLSVVHGELPVLLRASVALVSFTAGALLCELILGRPPARRTRSVWLGTLATCFALDAVVLGGFAIASVLTGDPATHPAAQVALLALAAFAMGPVGVVVGALDVPGVVADAVTGTLLQLARRFAQGLARRERTHPLRWHVLLGLCGTYTLAASVVTLSQPWKGRAFVPATVLVVVALLLLGARTRGLSGRTTGLASFRLPPCTMNPASRCRPTTPRLLAGLPR